MARNGEAPAAHHTCPDTNARMLPRSSLPNCRWYAPQWKYMGDDAHRKAPTHSPKLVYREKSVLGFRVVSLPQATGQPGALPLARVSPLGGEQQEVRRSSPIANAGGTASSVGAYTPTA